MRIENASALVSGGASGLGEATSRRLAEGGATVTIADVNEEKGAALAGEIGAEFVLRNVEFEDDAVYRRRYLEKLAELHDYAPLAPDARLWSDADIGTS